MTGLDETLSRFGVVSVSLFRIDVAPRQASTSHRFYLLQGALDAHHLAHLSRELLTDPVTETAHFYAIDSDGRFTQTFESVDGAVTHDSDVNRHTRHTVDVAPLPGVTDTTAESLVRAARQIGLHLQGAATGQRYFFAADLTHAEVERLAGEYYNPVIQRISIDAPIAPAFMQPAVDRAVETILIRAADDALLLAISAERRLALDLDEMRAIRAYYVSEDRDPTDVEIEMIAQTWSEHCVHKTFKAAIDYTGPAHGAVPSSAPTHQHIDGLLKTYIRAATDQVNKPWVLSAFVDNAGIIAFNDQFDLAFKVETHNHPSALEPFGGANTGVGGVVRDILGVSARPIANTDVLCFGYPDTPSESIPAGVLHPARIADGVVQGIADYGNKMGIPTVNGAIHYHAGYTANPLVFCGCLGIMPHGSHRTGVHDGDLIVVLGGRTGRDGLRGATFSSMEMNTATSQIAGSAVQIGHPIHEKQVQEAIVRLRDAGLYHAITDCGAGGLSSAVGEMAANMGACVALETVPLKYPGLRPWEIWLSEAQERMVLAVAPSDWDAVRAICAGQDVEAVAIGAFQHTGRLVLNYDGATVGQIAVEFLHDGIPRRHLSAVWTPPEGVPPTPIDDPRAHLLALLSSPTIRSKEDVIRRFDHEVQGGTAVKPLTGIDGRAPNDGAVIVPLDALLSGGGDGLNVMRPYDDSLPVRGVALSVGICPQIGERDPYEMAWAAVDEAMRNLVAVGADPDQVAILDNFCWGDPRKPDRLGALVRCAQGCYDAAIAYNVPFISGKDSLNNEYTDADGSRHAIPGTLLISAVGIVPDVRRTVTSDLKNEENEIRLVGDAHLPGASNDGHDPLSVLRFLHTAIQRGLIQSCHDVSEGGIGVALAEMCIGGRIGADIQSEWVTSMNSFASLSDLLFRECVNTFIIEVAETDLGALEALEDELGLSNLSRFLGVVNYEETLHFYQDDLSWTLDELDRAFRGHLIPTAPAIDPTPIAAVPSRRTANVRTTAPRALILHANGSNRDRDAALAITHAGGDYEIVHINQLVSGERRIADYQIAILPGGFSYGDDLGAGALWALDLRQRFADELRAFVDAGRPVMGICNGFQALVKAGILPGADNAEFVPARDATRDVTLTFNEGGRFECRWVTLTPNAASPCLFTDGLTEAIICPVAHGEGRIALSNAAALDRLVRENLIALTYSDSAYPLNPNGSALNIAGLTNRAGNVLGLMPHPEDHIFTWQSPTWRRGACGGDGLRLFQNAVRYA